MSKTSKSLKLKGSINEIGAIWLPGSSQAAVGGYLTAKKGKVEFLTSPTYQVLTPEELHEATLQFGGSREPEVIPIFHGRTVDSDFTLFWSHILDSPGVVDTRDGTQISSTRYRSGLLVSGIHLNAADTEEIDEAYLSFSTIHTFYSVEMNMIRGGKTVSFSYDLKGQSIFLFSSRVLEAEIEFQVVPRTKLSHKKGLRVLSEPRVRVEPRTPKSTEWFGQVQRRLENFFSLVLGTSISSEQVSLYKGQVEGHLVYNALQRKEKARYESRVVSTSTDLASALANWLAIPNDKQAVERTFLVVLRKSRLLAETEFLSLAQATEGFGRLKHGDIKFAEMLKLMFASISPGFVHSLWTDAEVFIRTVVDTRNHYTHPFIKCGPKVVADNKELFLTNRKLAGFLRCVMLLDIGLPETSLREAITDDCTRWR